MIFTFTKSTGHRPISAVVEASDSEQAAFVLNVDLIEAGLPGDAKPEDMIVFEDTFVRILCDGDY